MDTITRCGECNRTLAGGGQYSLGGSQAINGERTNQSAFDTDIQRKFGGQVITNIKANKKGDVKDSIPLEGIMTMTEFTRDVESMGGGSSEVDLSDKRGSSTDHIHDMRDSAV